MNTIVFLQGLPASGKSTFIEANGLKPYTICPDEIRMLYGGLVMGIEHMEISPKNDALVWADVLKLTEYRMKNGSLVVIDATTCSNKGLEKFKKLAKLYRYRTVIIRFDVSCEECIRRDALRGYKSVGENAIRKMYNNLQEFKEEKWFTIIAPEQFKDVVGYQFANLDSYKQVVHIGDVHGCYDALKHLEYSPDNYYIFCGDYFDRGLENAAVAEMLLEWMHYPNALFLYGNHERHIGKFLDGGINFGKEFSRTLKELKDAGITSSRLNEFYRNLKYVFAYEFNGQKVICTHGGLTFEPDDLRFVPNGDFIFGIGGYDLDVDNMFVPRTQGLVQVHGHRNKLGLPVNAGPHSYNLNSSVESGEPLRVLFLNKDGFSWEEYENLNPNLEYIPNEFVSLSNDSDIKKKDLGSIVSFNFTRDVFWDKRWNEHTILARGLFCNKHTQKVVARGYEKFFELGENEITSEENIKALEYPLHVYRKENGYLGLVGVNNGKLVFCSKSTTKGDFAGWLKEIFYKTVENPDSVLEYLQDNNACMAFEVIDSVNDPHIIQYTDGTRKIVLLDILQRDYKFVRLPYNQLVSIAKELGLEVKSFVKEIKNYDELRTFADATLCYSSEHSKLEGYVIEDSSEQVFHFKLKSGYYNFWKIVRNGIESGILKDKPEKAFANLAFYGLKNDENLNRLKMVVAAHNAGEVDLFKLEDEFG